MDRGVWLLQRFTIVLNKGGSSEGVRQFIKEGLPSYAQRYPHVKFDVLEGSEKIVHPKLVGHFVEGRQVVPLRNKKPKEIEQLMDRLRSRSGKKLNLKRWPEAITQFKSIQGGWTPNANVQYPVKTEAIRNKLYWEE